MMEETKSSFNDKQDDLSNPREHIEKSLLDFDDSDFVNLEASANNVAMPSSNPLNENVDLIGNLQSTGLASTTRPLLTGNEEEISNLEKIPFQDFRDDELLLPYEIPKVAGSDDDHLLIDESRQTDTFKSSKSVPSSVHASISPNIEKIVEIKEALPKAVEPKIVTKSKTESDNYESGISAYDSFAQPEPVKSKTAMESETIGNAAKNCEVECPFSPGAWFNPEKLHPLVAEYVYWKDPKKSGIAFGSSLILLLSLKYFSFISVVAYLILAILSVTISFRIYKNVLQAVQKSNEGHPFKEYLDMDITLSQEKVNETIETLINHINCVTTKFRSLILVEDLVDTIKLGILAWCLTYVGAWFNGMTLIILVLVAAFTLPKIYETNKTQIDTYAEVLRTKGKELIEMVNAKMPMCKKKKEQ